MKPTHHLIVGGSGGIGAASARRLAAAGRHPLQRIGDPEEVARLAVFLLEDPDSWTTGQVFHMDGGLSALRTGR